MTRDYHCGHCQQIEMRLNSRALKRARVVYAKNVDPWDGDKEWEQLRFLEAYLDALKGETAIHPPCSHNWALRSGWDDLWDCLICGKYKTRRKP